MSNHRHSMKCLVDYATKQQRSWLTLAPHRRCCLCEPPLQRLVQQYERRLCHSISMIPRQQNEQLSLRVVCSPGLSLSSLSSPSSFSAATACSSCRHISSTSCRLHQQHDISPKTKSKPSPFAILGVSTDDSYATVKKAFLKIAMTNHPDMHSKDDASLTKEDQDRMRQLFIEARVAFESLEATSTGHVVVKGETDKRTEEDDSFNAWFQQETGYDMPFMDLKTMKEVADMTDDMSVGLDRDGGMWTLAKMVTTAVRQGNQNAAANILQLEAGELKARKDGDIDGVLRRKRKPNRV